MRFPGFDSQGGSTAVPTAFFTELLPRIDHLGELKVTLYAIRSIEQRAAPQPYVDPAEMLADPAFASGFGETAEAQGEGLADALERAVGRGTLLAANVPEEAGARRVYLINSPRGRAALKGLEQGRWTPDAPEAAGEPTPTRPNIFQLYEKNIGPLTPILVDILKEAEKQYPLEWIEEAIGIALKNNVRKWRYVEAILQARGEQGSDDREAREAAEESGRKYIEGEFKDLIER